MENSAQAESLAESLVGERLAACINLVPGIRSVYRWQGNIEKGSEVLLLIKTTEARLPALEAAIKAHSSYELPEVLAVPVESGSGAYLNWIADAVDD